jgi:hypothetical protein
MRNVVAHWPTNVLACLFPLACKTREVAIEPPAAHRNQSDGSLAVSILTMGTAVVLDVTRSRAL